MGSVVIVEDLSKELIRNQASSFMSENFRETLIRYYGRLAKFDREVGERFFALKGVSFCLQEGETLMLIGKNGAGKSTLLKILSRITRPSAGKVTIQGRVVSILGVGAGFQPDLTGRENIYLCGVLLGMKRREIVSLFDKIVDFAEINPFLDSPVKHYSSGMMARLGFAIASHVPADVMLLDEVLTVGDAAFQKKCFEQISDKKKEGVSTILVTHNLSGAKAVCDRGILLHQGEMVICGELSSVIGEYSKILAIQSPVAQIV